MRRNSVLAMVALCAAGALHAETMDRMVLSRGGVVLEVSAPASGIMRIRMGRGTLPEDASWAVPAAARRTRLPLNVTRGSDVLQLSAAHIGARIDMRTLRVDVLDGVGKLLLADLAGRSALSGEGGFRMRGRMSGDDHVFGLGDKTGTFDRKGGAYTMWNSDTYKFTQATDPLYKTIPFFMTVSDRGQAYGLFLDNTWRTTFDFGKTERGMLSISGEGGPVDYYVMAGPAPKDVLQQYARLTGTPPLMPQWALGFQQSKWSYKTDAEVRAIAQRLRSERMPSDVVYMDIDYQDRSRPFTVNGATFPDMRKLATDLRGQGIRLVLITDPHVANAPGQGYAAYDGGAARDLFLKLPGGQYYSGDVWPGAAVFPDFSRVQARRWWGDLYAGFVGDGVAGFWNDMNEPSIFNVPSKTMPLDVVHRIESDDFAPRSTSHAEMHNVYGQLNSRATYEGLARLQPDVRPFVLTRATYAGGQRYAATWTGDNVSSWQHLKTGMQQLVNLGLSGFSWVGNDVGGYAGEPPSPELLTRWFQLGAFMPLFRAHAETGRPDQEPWVGDAVQVEIRRRFISERYRLLPYLYATAEENSRSGIPLLRPVFLNFPSVLANGDRLGGSEDQFMVGGDLLLAPSPTLESPGDYNVELPGKDWYDYWTGRRLDGKSQTVKPDIAQLPVYVRPGAIIPKQPPVQSTAFVPEGRLELHVYPGADCHGDLYADDGISMAYQRGSFLRQHIRCEESQSGLKILFEQREGSWRPWWSGVELYIHGWESDAPPEVHAFGAAVAASVDRAQKAALIQVPDMVNGSVEISRSR
ncbi:glycoside hydrolase family 31 protein [Duganella sp. Root198D2]|uniref:glycoside hydrolase family 31 protein n=1 Tax=Duganella sp. Root198D2 TaxID=1736489 RepID=UPI0009E6AD49|nr:glycoside hydrolase family 31 protein [Duganella sp. Root198D2]